MVRDIERDDIEFISKTLGCLPIAHVDHMRPEKLGHAGLVEEKTVRAHARMPAYFFSAASVHLQSCKGLPADGARMTACTSNHA